MRKLFMIIFVGTMLCLTVGVVRAETKLTASDGGASDCFGSSASISGDWAVVGARKDRSAYVFHYDGANWTEHSKLTGSDGGGSVFWRLRLDFR